MRLKGPIGGERLRSSVMTPDGAGACALALPYTDRFEDPAHGILSGLRRLGRPLLRMRREQIWHRGPPAAVAFPARPDSFLEVLDR